MFMLQQDFHLQILIIKKSEKSNKCEQWSAKSNESQWASVCVVQDCW